MKNLNWFQARDIAQKQGRAVRRDVWRKWLYYTPWYLWFIAENDVHGVQHRWIVKNGDFGSAEFIALDWTDEPWPDEPDPVNGPVTPPSPGPNWGPWPPISSKLPQPIPPIVIFSGGGGPPSGPPTDHPPHHNPPQNQPATVSVSVDYISMDGYDEGKGCIQDNGGGSYSGSFSVSVTVSGGPPGVGTLDVRMGTQSPQLGTAWDGYNGDFEFDDIPFSPGGSLTATANYSINGQTATGSGQFQIPDTCQPDYGDDGQ
jgi:hypothetical protein